MLNLIDYFRDIHRTLSHIHIAYKSEIDIKIYLKYKHLRSLKRSLLT